MKKLLTLLLAIALLFNLPGAVLAEQTGDLTINGTVAGKQYDLYRVFDLTQDASGDNYSYTVNADFAAFFSGQVPPISDPIAYVAALTADSAALSTLAQELLAWAIANDVDPVSTVTASGTSTQVTDLPYGYYLLNPLGGSVPTGSYATMFALDTLSGTDTTITVKAEYPSIDKVIVLDDEETKITDASIGNDIAFKLTTKVPDMTGYNYYHFLVKDTLSDGLSYKEFGSITIDGVALDSSEYTVEAPLTENGGTLRIIFNNLLDYASDVGKDVVITYTATLNEDAEIGTPNPNEVTLIYSNDPKVEYDGDDDPEDPDVPTGETPTIMTETFITSITISKVDQNGKALTGAAFEITGNGVNMVVITSYTFAEDDDGTYYKLKDGTYTETAPDGTNDDAYESTTITYARAVIVTTNTTTAGVSAEGTVGTDGKLTFAGLSAGTYTITETVTPPGYNTVDPIDVVIAFDPETETFSVTSGNATVVDNRVNLNIVNQSGTVLPETGGIGTTIFYIAGSLMMVVAAVWLVTKKRMSGKK